MFEEFAKRLGGSFIRPTEFRVGVVEPNPGLQPVGRMSAKGLMVKLLRALGGCLGARKR